jgi:hypothetical protein
LRSFGQNEFALPVFFEEDKKSYCIDNSSTDNYPQVISLNQKDSFKLQEIYKANYKVIHFPNVNDSEIQSLNNELNRILNTFDDLSISILSFIPYDFIENNKGEMESFLLGDRSTSYFYKSEDKDKLINCIYVFPTQEWDGKHPSEETIAIDHTLVLLDRENKIRGYYDGYETKEVDRLILEIRVLLSNK